LLNFGKTHQNFKKNVKKSLNKQTLKPTHRNTPKRKLKLWNFIFFIFPPLYVLCSNCFFCQFCDIAKVVVAKFGYKLNMKVIFKKKAFFYSGYLLELCIEIEWFFLDFSWIMATENLEKHLILPLLKMFFSFWLYIASPEKNGLQVCRF